MATSRGSTACWQEPVLRRKRLAWRMYKSDKLFGKWVKENGFGDMDRFIRANCMWLAENWDATVQRLHTTESHPTAIRQAYNEWLKSQEDAKASPDLPKAEDIKPTKVLTRKRVSSAMDR